MCVKFFGFLIFINKFSKEIYLFLMFLLSVVYNIDFVYYRIIWKEIVLKNLKYYFK